MRPLAMLNPLKFSILLLTIGLVSGCSSQYKYQPRDASSISASDRTSLCKSPRTVRSGDTLSDIAHQCNLDMREVARLNNLLPPYIIYINQSLVLPVSGQAKNTNLASTPVEKPVSTVTKPVANNQSEPKAPAPKVVKKVAPPKSEPKKTVKASSQTQPVKPAKPKATAKAISRTPYSTQSSKNSNEWIWPMNKGLAYKYRRDNAGLSVLEIYGVPGQEVKAVASGKVVYAGNGIANYGWMLVIKHDQDYMSIYAHNSILLVEEGQEVQRGEEVALMGGTGQTDRPKLYLEARHQGRKMDIKKKLKP